MKIRSINAMRGPNYWSVRRHKLIVMVLDLEEMEELPSNKVDGFRERLEKMFPTMIEHRCSVGTRGGFFERVDEGTWMGHIIEHIALETQTLAGMDTGFGFYLQMLLAAIHDVLIWSSESATQMTFRKPQRYSKTSSQNMSWSWRNLSRT